MTLFRPQRGGLDEAMSEAIEVPDLATLVRYLDCAPSAIRIEDYGVFDARIGWQTHLVRVDDFPVGFTNGPLAGQHIVHARFNPFAEHEPAISFQVEEGRTVAEIVRAAPGVPDWFWLTGEVRINGHRILRDRWGVVRPKLSRPDRPIIITLHPVYHGGGGGSSTKNIVTTVAAIALVAGATLVSGGLLGPAGFGILGASFAAGGLGANLLAAGLGLGATLLLSTLTPPAPEKQKQDSTQASTAGIGQNPLKPMQALPVVLGRIRMSPPLIAPPYTTLENGIVFVHAIFGLAGYYEIDTAEILLNAIAIDEFAEAEYQVRDGAPSNAELTICNRTVIQKANANSKLTNFIVESKSSRSAILVHQDNPDQDLPQWQFFKTAGDADEIRLRFFWPGGMQAFSGDLGHLPIRTEIRERGTSTWLKMPVIHVGSITTNEQIRKEIRLIFANSGGPRINEDSEQHVFAVYSTTADGQTFEYNAESYFANTAPTDQIPVMTAATTSGVTQSASSQNSAQHPWLASDNSPTVTFWQAANNSLPAWHKTDFGAAGAFTAVSFMLRAPNGVGNEVYAGKDFTFEGSNDGTNWDVLGTYTGITNWTTSMEQWFQLDRTGSYRYYRVQFTANNGGSNDIIVVPDLRIGITDAAGNNSGTIFASHVNIHDDGVDFYLDPATFPIGEYEVRVKRGLVGNHSDFNEQNYVAEGNIINSNFFEYHAAGGADSYRVRKAQGGFVSETFLESFATVANEYPFHASIHQKGVAMIAVRAPSVNLESLSAIFHSIVPIWQSGVWSNDAASSNPAALARHVLLSTEQNAEALAGELIEEEAFQEFYDFCTTGGHEFNAVVDGLSVIEVLRQVLAGGYAAPDWPGLWSVIYEYDRSAETPVQLFTPLDTRGLTVSKSFPRLPHALRPIFFDEDDDFNVNEASLVYMDGYDAGNATRIEEMTYPGFTDAAKVAARALFDLRTMYQRPTRYAFEIGLAGLACRRGDLVMLIHDVISRYAAYARIASIQRSGGNITGLKLEAKVNLGVAVGEIEETMAAGIQFTDRTTGTFPVNEKTETDTITFVTPFADPGDILAEGMSVGFGPVGSETKRMLVLWYEYVDELTRRITLIDEAPGLHA